MRPRRAHQKKTARTKASVRRKVLVAAVVAAAAALQIYLANIPRVVHLPDDEVNPLMLTKVDSERVEISAPSVVEGGLLLSYSGQAGDVADLHFENAIVDASNASLQSSLANLKPVPAKIAYATLPPAPPASPALTAGGDTCHTSVQIRRARGSSPVTSLNAFLENGSANNEQRRELRFWVEGGPLDVEIHTDAPPSWEGKDLAPIPGCSKVLQVMPLDDSASSSAIQANLIPAPVYLVIPKIESQKASSPAGMFRIELTPAFTTQPRWFSAGDFFSGVALGDNALLSSRLRILPLYAATGERLSIMSDGKSSLRLDQLAFSLNELKLRVTGAAAVEIDGKRLGFDFMRFLKENAILSGILVLINGSILLLFKETFFPRASESLEGSDDEG